MQKNTQKSSPIYKYKIAYMLDKMPRDKYKLFLDVFTQEVGVTIATLHNWKKIGISSKYSIPSEQLDRLAKLLGCANADVLKNYDTKQIRSIDKISKTAEANNYGLSKSTINN